MAVFLTISAVCWLKIDATEELIPEGEELQAKIAA
jgi:hypothetical protein